MKVLLIEDEPEVLYPVQKLLNSNNHVSEVIDFETFGRNEYKIIPEIIVIDLMDGGVVTDPTGKGGKAVFDQIWEKNFCPIIAYSSNLDLLDNYLSEENRGHPFIIKVNKGSGSEVNLYRNIEKLDKCVSQINQIKSEINTILQNTLRDSTKHLFDSIDKFNLQENLLLRLGRRRIAAMLDETSQLCPKILPWEQYICPPVSQYPQMGDLICMKPFDKSKPELFFVILTPSCDLIPRDTNEGEKPKVSRVLCVKCDSIEIKKDFAKKYKQGFKNGIGLVPGISSQLPTMTFDLKNNLTIIAYDLIDNKNEAGIEYIRVASIDSPFREHLAWHFSQIACRPGTPDRDFEGWQENEVKEALKADEKNNESN